MEVAREEGGPRLGAEPIRALPGRESECARIREAIGLAAEGRSQRVWLVGAPGTGKSAVCEWAINQASSFLPVVWACIEGESELPLGALISVLRPLHAYMTGLANPYRRSLGGLLEEGSGGDDVFMLGAATLALFAEAAEHRPLLLVIDDRQWIDPASATILNFALRRTDADATIAIVASRLEPAGSWLERSLNVIELGGLPPDAALGILSANGPIAPPVAETVIAATGGTPLALMEVSAQLTVDQRLGFEALPEPLPVGERLLKLYQDRIRPLDPETQLALGMVAAAGSAHQSIDPSLRRLNLSHESLAAAEEASVVRLGSNGPSFPHPLLRTASLAVLTPAQRRQVHAALAAVSNSLEERAIHLTRSCAGPSQTAADQLETIALTLSERQGAVVAAGVWLQAARLTPPGPSRVAGLLRAGQELASIGRSIEAKQCFDEVIATSEDPIARADALIISLSKQMFTQSVTTLGPEAAAEADLVETISPAQARRLRAIAASCLITQGRVDAALAVPLAADPGPDVAHLSPAVETTVFPYVLCLAGRHKEAVTWMPPERVRLMIGLAKEGRSDAVITESMQIAIALLTSLERRDEAIELATALIGSQRKQRRLQQLTFTLVMQGDVLLRVGRWQEAEAALSEARTLADHTNQPLMASLATTVLARLLAVRGEERYRQLCEDALDEARQLNFSTVEAYALHSLGLGCLSAGLFARSIDAFDRLSVLAEQVGLKCPVVVPYRADHIEALIRGGRSGRAGEIADLFALDVSASDSRWARGTLARVKAMLSADESANGHFDASLRDLVDQPFEAARTELCWGEFLRRRREIPESRTHLDAAARLFDRLDARPWAERARNELRASGARIPQQQRTILSELTPQEMQVATCVGQGNSNRETAEQLFISPKTVEYHLSHIYQKLGLRSRTDLTRLLSTLTGS